MLLHREDRRGWKSTSATLIPLISAMSGQRPFPWRLYRGGKFGMEEQHVLLDNLGVANEEALRTGCQRTE